MYYEQTVAPTGDVIDFEDLVTHARINTDDNRNALAMYLHTAQEVFERLSGRQLLTATYKAYFDAWHTRLFLPMPPLQTVASVKYYDNNNVLQTLSSTLYHVQTVSTPGILYFTPGMVYPNLTYDLCPKVVVEYTAGYGSASQVPHTIKQAIMLLTMHYDAERSAYKDSQFEMRQVPMGLGDIINQYRCILPECQA